MIVWNGRFPGSYTLAARVTGIGGYDTVFLGFPIWGTALPAPVSTFLTTHDLSRRTLVPFITHGGYGTGSAPQTIAELAPNSRILDPFVMQVDQERKTLNRVSAWLRDLDNANRATVLRQNAGRRL